MFDLKAYLKSKQRTINAALSMYFNTGEDTPPLVQAMRYALMAGGKRIRPVLCMAGAEAVGGDSDDVIEPACAIEMIHTYSLIHDDLPAMDNDELRRGKPTLHVAFDEATAILAGDALLTMAFEVLASMKPKGDVSAQLNVLRALARAAGHNGMIEGQMRDLSAEGRTLELGDLQALHRLKTGALIEAALYTGAVMAGGNQKQVDQILDYGRNIGLAFQIVDDILNVAGDPEILGKATGTDATRQKSTYPSLLGLEPSRACARDAIAGALQALIDFDNKADPLRALAVYIVDREK